MGAASSAYRYHRLSSNSSVLLNQPLLENENQSMEPERQIRANWEKIEEDQVHGLKYDFSRLVTRIQSKLESQPSSKKIVTKDNNKEAIGYLERKIENLKKQSETAELEFKLERRDKDTALALQGSAIKKAEEKIISLENKIEGLEKANKEIRSKIAEISAVLVFMTYDTNNTKSKVLPVSTYEDPRQDGSGFWDWDLKLFIIFIGLLICFFLL